jgi:hypothetical protein
MTSERAQAYGRIIKTLEDLGPSKLHATEQERIRDAADTLLFCEDIETAKIALTDVRELTDSLVESGRWLEDSAEKLLRDLDDAGPLTRVS